MMILLITILVFALGISGCQSVDLNGTQKVSEDNYVFKNGEYMCDSTGNHSNEQLSFWINGNNISGAYRLSSKETETWFSVPDTVYSGEGEFEGSYTLNANGFRIQGDFNKSIEVSMYDTTRTISGYMAKEGYVVEGKEFISDTINEATIQFNSKYKLSSVLGGYLINDLDTMIKVEEEMLVWVTQVERSRKSPKLSSVIQKDSLFWGNIKGDLSSDFRIRLMGDFTFDAVEDNYWLYCNHE